MEDRENKANMKLKKHKKCEMNVKNVIELNPDSY